MTNRETICSLEQLSTELLKEIGQKRYGSGTIGNYRRALSRIGRFMGEKRVNIYASEVGEEFIADLSSNSSISESHIRFTKTVVRRLNDVNDGKGYRLIEEKVALSVPPQYSELFESYLRFCSSIGNKESTIAWKRWICGKFLSFLADMGCSDAKDINTDYICRVIIRFTNKDAYAVVRAFLRYLHESGAMKLDYSGVIPKHSRCKVLPTTYSADEVHRLEATIDQSTNAGKRDYAVLLLATRLGLRSGDIVGLTYENVDFVGNSISLTQEKTKHPLTLPLLPEIRTALKEYIQYARPDSNSNFIFLSANAPFGRMTTAAIRHALTASFISAGINISGKKHGPHSLRSSLASSMVNDGVPYEVIRRLLGHHDPNAVKHYAKIDIENLRSCAIDVPPPSGNFKALLEGRV